MNKFKVQKQTKLFYGSRHQNSGFPWDGGSVNDHNRIQDSLRF